MRTGQHVLSPRGYFPLVLEPAAGRALMHDACLSKLRVDRLSMHLHVAVQMCCGMPDLGHVSFRQPRMAAVCLDSSVCLHNTADVVLSL
jgi:hypothetical protein